MSILILGAGLTGLATAVALEQKGFNVTVVDMREPKPSFNPDEYALRVSAMNSRSTQLFEQLGILESIQSKRYQPYECMRVWCDTGDIHFHAGELGVKWLGSIVENCVIEDALLETYQGPIKVGKPIALSTHNGVTLTMESSEVLKADLIIGADGAHSWVRSAAKIETDIIAYQQKGVVAVVESEQVHHNTAYQRFLTTGPLAFLPLDNPKYCSIVWSCPDPMADELTAMSEGDFNAALTEAFEATLGAAKVISKRAAFPLKHHHAKTYVKERVCLVGDAAHAIHPLAGQGANLGFGDVIALTEILLEAQQKQRPIYTLHTLSKYERARRKDNELIRQAMTALNNLFSNEKPLLSALRGAGLNVVNELASVKALLAGHCL